MNAAPPPFLKPVSQEKILRKLFLTLFLRGRSSRGLQKGTAPKSIGRKLLRVSLVYALMGFMSISLHGQPVFVLSIYLHSMTLVFLGMFVAASTGEVLFNKEEGDILMHRPVDIKALLRAKIIVILQVSVWLAAAFNLAGLVIGIWASDGNWLYPLAHAASTILEALFCVGLVVLVYQLCLRWFGREKLDGLMTTTQVLMAVSIVLGGQIIPRVVAKYRSELGSLAQVTWIRLLPSTWFASIDDAISGSGAMMSWAMSGFAVIITAVILWLAFEKLANSYASGLQNLNEAKTFKPASSRGNRRSFIEVLMNVAPMRWWLRDSVTRASFRLTISYLLRDRDVKLRVYPGLAPMLVVPAIFLFQDNGSNGGFGVAFSAFYLGIIPLLAVSMLKYSQQWLAADIFRAAPIAGPAAFCHGTRKAVLFFMTVPLLVLFATLIWLISHERSHLPLLLPGLIMVPLYALIPCIGGGAVPLSLPTEEAKSASRGFSMIFVMLISAVLAGLALFSWSHGWFYWMLLVEFILMITAYAIISLNVKSAGWDPLE